GARPEGDRPQRQERQAGDSRPERGPRDDRDQSHGGNRGQGRPDRPPNRSNDRREDRRPPRDDRAQGFTRSAAPPKRTTVDPDSPFAALSALKLQLEKRSNETGS